MRHEIELDNQTMIYGNFDHASKTVADLSIITWLEGVWELDITNSLTDGALEYYKEKFINKCAEIDLIPRSIVDDEGVDRG